MELRVRAAGARTNLRLQRRGRCLRSRCLLLLLLGAPLVTGVHGVNNAATGTIACDADDAGLIVALMASVLMNRDCHGVADNKCPVSTAMCLPVLARIVLKMPECTPVANVGKSQFARLETLIKTCAPATPVPTRKTSTAPTSAATSGASGAGNDKQDSLSLGETSTRSTASSSAVTVRSTRVEKCSVGVALCAVAAAWW